MFEKINNEEVFFNVFNKIGKDWMLITAGDIKNHNTMTASWGGFGVLWHEPVVTIYVRPNRYTREFIDKQNFFTVSFYDETKREALTFCGRNSGRDVNKEKKINFTPKIFDESIAFEEANLVFVCEKLFCHQINSDEIIKKEIIRDFYEDDSFHYVYIGKITAIYKKN